jgi:hypothetical protein
LFWGSITEISSITSTPQTHENCTTSSSILVKVDQIVMTSPSTLLGISNQKKLLTFVEGFPMMFMEKT